MFFTRKSNFFLTLLFFLFTSLSFANVYYLPHIHTSSDAWETYLIVDPVLNGPVYYELTLFDDAGNVVSTQTGIIPRNNEFRLSLREYGGTCGIFKTKIYPVRVRLGYIAKDDLGGGTAEFSLPSKLSMQAIMTLSNYYHQLTWSGFALFNGSNHDISVTAYGYKDGAQIVSKTFEMAPYTKVVDFFDNFFGLSSFTDIDMVSFSTDYPALTGIVISGKDNDKLLFSPSYDTVPNHSINNEEYFDGYFYQKGLVHVNGHYYTYINHGGTNYLRKIYSGNDYKFDMYELAAGLFGYDIIASSDNENLILLGTNDNGKFIVAKITPIGDTIWETEVGTYDNSWLSDLDSYNIVGQAIDGSVIVAFHDTDENSGKVITLNDENGSIIATHNYSASGRFYKAFVYSGYVGIAWKYGYGGKTKLQFRFYDSNGSTVKTIYADSPINPDDDNVFFEAFGSGDYIYSVFGVKINDGGSVNHQYYSTYAMVVPYADSDFSNATIISLPFTFLSSGSIVYSGFTVSFNSSSYDTSWVIMTSPYYNGMNSQKIILGLKDNLPVSTFSVKDMPYKVTGIFDFLGVFLITGQQSETIDPSTIRTKFIEKTLFGNNILNY